MPKHDSSSTSGFALVFGTLWCAGMVSIGITTALHIGDYSGWDLGSAIAAIFLMFLCFLGGVAGFAAITGWFVEADDRY